MRGRPYRFTDFRGGVNTTAAPYLVAETEAREALNIVSTTYGSIRKRNGCQAFAEHNAIFHSLFAAHGLGSYLIGAASGNLYTIDTSGNVDTLKTGMNATAHWEFIEAPAITGQGPLYGMNGVDTPQQWDGAAGLATDWTATSGTLPNGKYIIYHDNRVFVAGMATYGAVTDAPSTVVFSDIGNPRSWPVANVVTFEPNDGQVITGLSTIGPYILVFKRDKFWVIYDSDTGANRQISENTGSVSHRSNVETPQGTFFLSADQGVFHTNGSTITPISSNIDETLKEIVPIVAENAAGGFHEDHYYLSIQTGTVNNDLTVDFDLNLKTWWIHDFAATQWALWTPAGQTGLYAAYSSRQNLLANPEGALGTSGWTNTSLTTFAAGTLGAGGFPAATAEMSALGITTGIHCVGDATLDRASQTYQTVSGGTYQLSMFVYVVSNNAILRLRAVDPPFSVVQADVDITGTGQWQRWDISFVAASAGAYFIETTQSAAGAVDWYFSGALVERAEVLGEYINLTKISNAFLDGVTQDNGTNFLAYWKGPWLTYNHPELRKRMREVVFDGFGDIDVYVGKDFAGETLEAETLFAQSDTTFGGSGTFGGTGAFGDTGLVQEGHIYTLGTARAWTFMFRILSNTIAEVDSYTTNIIPRKD